MADGDMLNLVYAPSGTWVLRGGDLGGASREKNYRDVFEAYGLHGICVKAEPGSTPEEIASYGRFANRQYMAAQSDDLVADGYHVVQEPGKAWPDAILVFTEGEPDDAEWQRLRELMLRNGLQDNPTYQGK